MNFIYKLFGWNEQEQKDVQEDFYPIKESKTEVTKTEVRNDLRNEKTNEKPSIKEMEAKTDPKVVEKWHRENRYKVGFSSKEDLEAAKADANNFDLDVTGDLSPMINTLIVEVHGEYKKLFEWERKHHAIAHYI